MSELSGTQYGGFWIRFVALLADSAIVFVVSLLLLAGAAMALGAESLAPVSLLVWLLGFLYWPVMHASERQATFGKALAGLKVSRVDGGRISLLRSFGRELAKILSSMVLMVGFLMAAFTGRKQALHDLMTSTCVVREGPSRVIPALAVAVAGFALPVVLIPMLVGDAVVSSMTGMMADAVMSSPPPAQQAARPAAPVPPKAAPKPQPPVQQASTTPKPAPLAAAPAPAPAAPKPAVVAAAPAPAPVVAVPAPIVEAKPAEVPKPKAAPVRVAAAPATAAKPKPAAAVPAFEPKATPGPKFNDLMTAVLYSDAEGVSELLKLGKWPDKRDSRGATPLMVAVELGHAAAAEALLRAGADARLAIPVAEERRDPAMIMLLKRYASR